MVAGRAKIIRRRLKVAAIGIAIAPFAAMRAAWRMLATSFGPELNAFMEEVLREPLMASLPDWRGKWRDMLGQEKEALRVLSHEAMRTTAD
jgi:hypothetical protein